jgi:lipopolysaccharide transport system permease protein
MFKALWRYRQFVLSSVRNEFITRFSRSTLGGLWMVLNPLAQVAIYAIIFSNILSSRMEGINSNYSFVIYLTAGTMAWNLFSEIILRCLNLFIINGNLMKKVMFPKIVLPATVVGITLLDNVMLFVAILGFYALVGYMPNVQILWLPVLTLATVGLGIGFGLILGVLNVFVRDIGQVVPIILQISFWFTPIVYPIKIIPVAYRQLLVLNPMFSIVKGYQDVLVYGVSPQFTQVGVMMFVSLFLLNAGFFLFKRASEEMADSL